MNLDALADDRQATAGRVRLPAASLRRLQIIHRIGVGWRAKNLALCEQTKIKLSHYFIPSPRRTGIRRPLHRTTCPPRRVHRHLPRCQSHQRQAGEAQAQQGKHAQIQEGWEEGHQQEEDDEEAAVGCRSSGGWFVFFVCCASVCVLKCSQNIHS